MTRRWLAGRLPCDIAARMLYLLAQKMTADLSGICKRRPRHGGGMGGGAYRGMAGVKARAGDCGQAAGAGKSPSL